MSAPILSVRHVGVSFPGRRGTPWRRVPPVQAVRDACFDVGPGETVGLVGESGSGKTTLARALLRLVPVSSGSITFDGLDVLGLSKRQLRGMRRRMQVIFQDPYTSLNPRLTAGGNVAEGLIAQKLCRRRDIADQVARLLRDVHLPADCARRLPNEFSGGQRQRLVIARALAVEPAFLVADEPVSALDMSVRAQILDLLMEHRLRRGLSILFIGHDLSEVRRTCDRVIVMRRGRIVEIGPAVVVLEDPAHAYTKALLKAAPATHPSLRRRIDEAEFSLPPSEDGDRTQAALREIARGHLVADGGAGAL